MSLSNMVAFMSFVITLLSGKWQGVGGHQGSLQGKCGCTPHLSLKGSPLLSSLLSRLNSILSCVMAGVPIGPNLGRCPLRWRLLSGRLLQRRGAVLPGVAAFGRSAAAVRRAWAALAYGRWHLAGLLSAWHQRGQDDGLWPAHRQGGSRPVACDLVGCWRPRWQSCPTQPSCAQAGQALPALSCGPCRPPWGGRPATARQALSVPTGRRRRARRQRCAAAAVTTTAAPPRPGRSPRDRSGGPTGAAPRGQDRAVCPPGSPPLYGPTGLAARRPWAGTPPHHRPSGPSTPTPGDRAYAGGHAPCPPCDLAGGPPSGALEDRRAGRGQLGAP